MRREQGEGGTKAERTNQPGRPHLQVPLPFLAVEMQKTRPARAQLALKLMAAVFNRINDRLPSLA